MKDDDPTDRDHRDERPFGANRRSRAAGGGFERLFEDLAGSAGRFGNSGGRGLFDRIVSDVSSWFDDDRDARRRAGADDGGFRAERAPRDGTRADWRDAAGAASTPVRPDLHERDDYADEDGSETGSFRGRGPRNYHRSDERIAELVNDALQDDDALDASDIEVSVQGGDVTLSGGVTLRRLKHRAENVAARVSGVHDVDNRLRVRRGAAAGEGRGTPGGTPGGTSRGTDDHGHP